MQFHKGVWIFLFAIVFLSATLKAQTAGTISGVVEDESSAVIPGARLTVTNEDTGIARPTLTDGNGRYRVTGLIPGRYQIQAEQEGFQTEVRRGLTLNVGSEIAIPFVLKPGQVTQTVEVTGEAPIVETTANTLGRLVEGNTVRDLPLNGRSFDLLIALESSALNTGPGNNATGFGNQFVINGALPNQNVYLVDGLELIGAHPGSTIPGGALSTNMGVDGVQEFKVLTGSYSAVYGKRSGGVINIATRGGTNQIHGSAYEFLRNDKLAARSFFDPTDSVPPYKRNQYGSTLGGPIRRDQTFFFVNYEGLRIRQSDTTTGLYPDENARRGLLPCRVAPATAPCDTATGLANVGVHPAIVPYLVLLPPINGENFGDGTGYHIKNASSPGNQDYGQIRIDHKLSDEDSLMGRYTISTANRRGRTNRYFMTASDTKDQSAILEYKKIISPTSLNTLRFGFTRGYTVWDTRPDGTNPAAADRALAFPGLGAEFAGRINFSGSAIVGGQTATLSETGSSQPRRPHAANYFEVSDQFFHQRGAHGLSFGGQLQRIQHNEKYSFYDRGSVGFAGVLSFLAGAPSSFLAADTIHCSIPDPPGCNNGVKGYRQIYFSTFLQDDYRVRPNLTLNLGLRYEFMTVPVEVNDKISNWHPAIINGVSTVETNPTLGSPFYHGNHNQFAPRVGLAWDVFGSGKTAVRAGFGIFYDATESVFQEVTSNNGPFYNATTISRSPWPPSFSSGQIGLPTGEGINPNYLETPTRLEYNLNIQQQITPTTAFTIGYVGARGYHLVQVTDPNLAIPQLLSDGSPGCSTSPCYYFAPGLTGRNPALGTMKLAESSGNSTYQALQLNFQKRLSYGVRANVSFTYGKSINDNSDGFDVGSAGSNNVAQIQDRKSADRGLSTFDMRRNLVMNFTYELPLSFSGAPRRLVVGWRLGTIATLSDGTPLTALTGFRRAPDNSRNSSQRPNLAPGASNNPVLGGPNEAETYFDPTAFELPPPGFYGNVARNTLIGPGKSTVNLTLEKATVVTERLTINARAEFFNLLNRANFGDPSTNIFNSNGTRSPTAGRITSADAGRQIQFGLKLLF